jgi:beta-lactam-binding protein with PASTA domain
MSLKGARAVLQAAGLVVGQTVNVPNLNYLPGTVTAQDPAAGTKVERRSFVDLEVSAL